MMGDACPPNPLGFCALGQSGWSGHELFACIFSPLQYNDFACAEDRALQGWNSSAATSPEWKAASQPPHSYTAPPSKDACFFVQPMGSTSGACHAEVGCAGNDHMVERR